MVLVELGWMGKERELTSTESMDMWCDADSSAGLEQRAAVPTCTPGMDGKAREVEERAPRPVPAGKGGQGLCNWETNFLILCVYVLVCFCLFSNRTRNWTSSTRRTQSPCFAPV